MAVLVTDLRIGLSAPEEEAVQLGLRRLGVPKGAVHSADLHKKSLDARRGRKPCFVVSVLYRLDLDEQALCARLGSDKIRYQPEAPLEFPHGDRPLHGPVVIAGFGPAGLFCAYALAREGYRPIVLERGEAVEHRVAAVERFWSTGRLEAGSNVQFGEGGAGTFSDGKLTTRISDERCGYVLQTLAAFGAPEEILVKAKPHIGTDRLRGVIRNLRLEIERLGGKVCFGQKLEALRIRDGVLRGIVVNGQEMPVQALVAAIGHSARDTFSMLLEAGVEMEAKSFSVGMRIEQLQAEIDRGLYGGLAGHPALPPGEYQLSWRENGRGVYTFCMCPGGVVVPSSSEPGMVVTNGMSEYRRDGQNANAALVVSVTPEDFGTHPLDGVQFQRRLEQEAFRLGGGGYQAVGTTVAGFLQGTGGLKLGRVTPSYALGVAPCRPEELFPPFVTQMLRQGLVRFERRLPGFAAGDCVLTGPETRTSSPLRILRDGETLMSRSVAGLYPCGEGAGYAGGIMSAAVDGLRVAQRIISCYRP